MIFLINRQRIYFEVMRWATLKISEELGCDSSLVSGSWAQSDDGSIKPEFKIDESAQGSMGSLADDFWVSLSGAMSFFLSSRLQHLSDQR